MKRNIYFYIVAVFVLLMPIQVFSAGMTTHGLIAYWIEHSPHSKVDHKLSDILKHHEKAYRNGAIFPDVAEKYLDTFGGKLNSRSDDLSHGVKHISDHKKYINNLENGTTNAGGMINAYFHAMQSVCGSTIVGNSSECNEAYAFWIGMVSHIISDVPWHREWIMKTVKTHKKGDTWKRRHIFADNDMDIQLAKILNNQTSYKYRKITKIRKNSYPLQGCKDVKGFWSIVGGKNGMGACYKCYKGYTHDPLESIKSRYICKRKVSKDIKISDLKKVGSLPKANSVTNTLSISTPSLVGNGFAIKAFHNMKNESSDYKNLSKLSTDGLLKHTQKILTTQFMVEHLAGRDKLVDKKHRYNGKYQHLVKGKGGLRDTLHITRGFINTVWDLTKKGKSFEIVRLDKKKGLKGLNYGILHNKKMIKTLY